MIKTIPSNDRTFDRTADRSGTQSTVQIYRRLGESAPVEQLSLTPCAGVVESSDSDSNSVKGQLQRSRLAQTRWSVVPLDERVAIVRRLRKLIAMTAKDLGESVPTHLPGALSRSAADTLAAEVLPLIEACRFIEREAERLLRPRVLNSKGAPDWLGHVTSKVEREPWGVVLILGAANYPLFLGGVQSLQALVAGNAVVWKPAPGTEFAARALRTLLLECGIEADLLRILESDVESATQAINAGVDYVVLTGSANTGRAVFRQLAETLTPSTMELSGSDAVFVLHGSNLKDSIARLTFGLRFNGSFTCMAPRRVFLIGFSQPDAEQFELKLSQSLKSQPAVLLDERTFTCLEELIGDAQRQGARVILNGITDSRPDRHEASATLITNGNSAMKSMQAEIFAPILTVMRVADVEEALAANATCAYALTAAIFGSEKEARALASRLKVGNILINDIVTSTADPRIPFGGRGQSGFGVTRGAEGLLSMTTPRTTHTRRAGVRRPERAYQPTGYDHIEFFAALAQMLHAGFLDRCKAVPRLIQAARKIK